MMFIMLIVRKHNETKNFHFFQGHSVFECVILRGATKFRCGKVTSFLLCLQKIVWNGFTGSWLLILSRENEDSDMN